MEPKSAHFSTEALGIPTSDGRFVKVDDTRPAQFFDGLDFRPILGDNILLNFVTYAPGAEAPRHVHQEEQIVIALDGDFEFEIDGVVQTMRRGDVAVVPSWVPHAARAGANGCVEVDVFNPPRETLVEHAKSERERLNASSE